MTMVKVYLWAPKQRLLLPTVAETDSGFFVECEPLASFEAGDVFHWKKYLTKMLSANMPLIETPDSQQEPGSAILEKLDLSSWSEFEKHSTLFTIHLGNRYTTIYATGAGDDGMWSHAKMTERKFHPRTPVHNIVEAVANDILRHPQASKPQPLMLTSRG